MTASSMVLRAKLARPSGGKRAPRAERPVAKGEPVPPLTPKLQLFRSVLIVVVVMSISLLLHLGFVSSLQQRAAQGRAYSSFRAELARGTAPIGPADADGVELEMGRPVAYVEIRAIGLEAVVGEGTSAEVLFDGLGHRRDTPLPGQVGTSVVFGRRAAYGGPFDRISELTADDKITVTTGQGAFEYRVIGLRREGDPAPTAPAAGTSRLMLVTAAGPAFLPNGVLRVDTELVGQAVIGPARAMTTAGLPTEERAMENQTDTLWALALWLQGLILLSVGVIWGWLRWGRAQAWIVFTPALALVGMSAASEVAKLMPNLL
jgi:sortase A